MVLDAFRRGAVRLHILHHACGADIHGAWMRDELAEHGHDISPGTLYPLLHKMEANGLLTSWDDVTDGHTRRLYRATDVGRTELERCREALRELADEVLPADNGTT